MSDYEISTEDKQMAAIIIDHIERYKLSKEMCDSHIELLKHIRDTKNKDLRLMSQNGTEAIVCLRVKHFLRGMEKQLGIKGLWQGNRTLEGY